MMTRSTFKLALLPLCLATAYASLAETNLDKIYVTAERQLQQSLGVSKISSEDLDKQPVVSDVSEIVRTMPGANLTGNTATGQRGNKRQIDLRGMGPENTLILIDGIPVTSRQSERISMRGERNTRGDSNWVPVEAIESIEVLRGPSAARYGSGAMGGVVNIITKKPANKLSGSFNWYMNQPKDNDEGATSRFTFNLNGPIISDVLSFRLYGSYNKTEADSPTINQPTSSAAGLEGVRNKDIGSRLHWKISPSQSLDLDASYSRQGNIYNGDAQNGFHHRIAAKLIGELSAEEAETQRLYRRSVALTHKGAWDWGDTKNIISYDQTTNSHLPEYLAGGPEGSPSGREFVVSRLKNLYLKSETYIPFTLWRPHVLTIGAEFVSSHLDDPGSMKQGFKNRDGTTDVFTGLSEKRDSAASQQSWAIYAEDNISLFKQTNLIPTLRFDHNSKSGNNVNGGLSFSQQLAEHWRLKGGMARAYKAPNLYQSNPNFLLASAGNGCPIGTTVSCYFAGNPNIKPETSWNKELGIEFKYEDWQASLTYFHNRYRNKIVIGYDLLATSNIGNHLYQWENSPSATIAGIEGNLVLPLLKSLKWSNNFTYMQKSEDYQGNPLSLVPKHTINSTLSWTPNERWDANLIFTHYGRIKPRAVAINRVEKQNGLNSTELSAYSLLGFNVGYRYTKKMHIRLGVSNLFDKKFYRTTKGAQTFNQHGRSVYANLKVNF